MNNNNLYDTICKVNEYIEANLKSKITQDEIAAVTYFSKFYLQRIFKRLTNKNLMSYVKSRQLAMSAVDLLRTDLRIIDVANEYGFKYYQSYTRAFKNEFKITPEEFRKGKDTIKIVEKINMDHIKPVGKGIIIKPDYVIKPEFNIIGIKHKIYIQDNLENQTSNKIARDFYYNKSHKIKNRAHKNTYIGLTKVPEGDSDYTYYIPSFEVLDIDEIPEGMISETISTQKYAVFKYIGMHSVDEVSSITLREIWNYIYSTWMPKIQSENCKRMRFEYICSDKVKDTYCEVDIYYPIRYI